MTKRELLRAGAEHIDAVQISPRRWAHRDEGTRSWWIVSPEQLRELGRMLRSEQDDAYSLWCSDHAAREMPDGWTP